MPPRDDQSFQKPECIDANYDGDDEDESERDDFILGLLWPVEPSIRLVHNSEESHKSKLCGSIPRLSDHNAAYSQMGDSRTN